MPPSKILINVVVQPGLDHLNENSETYIDLKVFSDAKLSFIHAGILNTLMLNGKEDYYYSMSEKSTKLSMNMTLKDLGVEDGMTLNLETSRNSRFNKNNIEDRYNQPQEYDEEDVLHLTCTTRITDQDGNPFKKLKILGNITSILLHY